jgi:hypothetical protein
VDEHCQHDPNGISNAMGLWLDIMISFYAGIKLPIGPVIETPWVGKILDPSYQGYLWMKTLTGICGPDNTRYFENKLNNKFKSIATSLNGETLDEYEEFIPAIDSRPPAAKNPGVVTVTQHPATVDAPYPATTEIGVWRIATDGAPPVQTGTIWSSVASEVINAQPVVTIYADNPTGFVTQPPVVTIYEPANQPPVVTIYADYPTEGAYQPSIVTVTQPNAQTDQRVQVRRQVPMLLRSTLPCVM